MLNQPLKAILHITLTGSMFLLVITSGCKSLNPPFLSQPNIRQTEVDPSTARLIPLLLDNELETRETAFKSLKELGADLAVPALIQALQDKDWQVQAVAAYTLGRFGSEAQAAIPALSQAIKAENADIRFVVARTLGEIGSESVVPALIEALQDEDENVRVSAAEALKKIGSDAKTAVPALTKALWDGNWYVRSRSAEAISQLGWDAIDLPTLMEPWRGDNPPSSGAIVSLMIAIQPSVLNNLEKIPLFFIKSLQDEDPNVRQSAAMALGEFSGPHLGSIQKNKAVNALIKSLQDGDSRVRQIAAESLRRYDLKYDLPPKESSALVSALIEALKDEDPGVRQSAAQSLSRYEYDEYDLPSNEASAVVSALIEALKDEDPGVRQSAAQSLSINDLPSKESSAVISALIEALRDKDPNVRRSAAESLNEYDLPSNEVSALLTEALKDEATPQRTALDLWKNDQLNTQKALDIFREGLLSKDPLRQIDAVIGLGTIGAEAKPLLSSLLPLLQEDIEPLRYSAALAITDIAPQKECVPILGEMLNKETAHHIRETVHSALEQIGSQEAFLVEIESWQFEDIERRYVTTCTTERYIPDVFRKSSDSYVLLLQALENENIRSSVVNSMPPYYFFEKEKLLITSNLVNIVIPGLIKVLENKYEGNSSLKEIFEFKDRDIRRSAAYALGEIANSTADNEDLVIIKDKDNKQKIIDALTVVVENQQEDIDIRWMAATSLQKLGINQDSFFTEYNLINPLTVKCPFQFLQLPHYNGLRFHRYYVQCYYDVSGQCGAGFGEIYSELRRRLSRRNTAKK